MKKRDLKGRYIYAGGKSSELKDNHCLDCGKNILRESKYCRSHSQTGKRSSLYKSEKIGYFALHKWINKWHGKATFCTNNTSHKAPYYWANKSGLYLRDIADWYQLCATCNNTDGIKISERFHKEVGINV